MTTRGLSIPAALGLVVAGPLTGCAAGGQLPEDVSARTYQTRSDVAADRIEIQIRNGSDRSMTVTAAQLRAPQLETPAQYFGPTEIPARSTIDLKTPLPAADCSGSVGAPEVAMSFLVGGQEGHAVLPAPDTLEQLPAIAAQQCRQNDVESRVGMSPPAAVAGGRPPGPMVLTFRLAPTGAPGRVRILTTRPTTLLSPASPSGRLVPGQRVAVTLRDTDPPVELGLRYVPSRCDAHALAEDKMGTLLPVLVSMDGGTPGPVILPVPQSLRSAIHRTVARWCGLAD